ncbi:ADP-ribose glycohydrolase MACROD1 isoform X6 [Takifugu rubripes]|uniref:ADP-ribose glycohydrolase MACROD1 isoform X6 n=1 Tax=Takifugu rubripes TaxID=31033 RepID=UPI0005D194E8|nr:ADP-ribose glycohydrolase MACROD1 isoform X6 [Takifugu rubripes]XP_056900096.1 ADP-ribose glycohydrolase MACROD1 isoform X2 [Takifugu flavidus]|eukprot:XP_011608819.1 PREDICTED: O-acetyl-ADP-ribose deacetylase MACROD1 isoform X2 [Takifugu rubripes]
MALQMAALFAYKSPLCTGPLPRITANFQGAGAKFKHILSPGSQHFVKKPPTSLRGHFNIAPRGETFSKSAAVCTSSQKSGSSICRGGRGILGKIALGLAAGVSTATLVQSLHTGTFSAMAIKVNLNSAEGNWKEIKEFLLSCSVKDRRQYYRTSGFVPLDDIPAWTPTTGPPEQVICKRNENLDQKISLYSGDITKLEIDAIVNAVDGAIHRAAGPMLVKECASLQGCETGQAKITCGYGLPAKYVIHTVGPIAQGRVGEVEKEALRSCYRNSLNAATQHAARSVAFPCISTGIYGYPPEEAVHEALTTVREYLDEHHDKLDRVIFCVFLPSDKKLYLQNLPLYFPGAPTIKSKL